MTRKRERRLRIKRNAAIRGLRHAMRSGLKQMRAPRLADANTHPKLTPRDMLDRMHAYMRGMGYEPVEVLPADFEVFEL